VVLQANLSESGHRHRPPPGRIILIMDPNRYGSPPGFTLRATTEDRHWHRWPGRSCLAPLHFEDTVAPESGPREEWPPTDDYSRWYCTGVLRALLPDEEADYRSLAAQFPLISRRRYAPHRRDSVTSLEDTLYTARMWPDRARLMLDHLTFWGALFDNSPGW